MYICRFCDVFTEFPQLKNKTPNRPTDGPTNGPTDRPSYRDAWTHLKRPTRPKVVQIPNLLEFHLFSRLSRNACQTDKRTNGPTDQASYRVVFPTKKTPFMVWFPLHLPLTASALPLTFRLGLIFFFYVRGINHIGNS